MPDPILVDDIPDRLIHNPLRIRMTGEPTCELHELLDLPHDLTQRRLPVRPAHSVSIQRHTQHVELTIRQSGYILRT